MSNAQVDEFGLSKGNSQQFKIRTILSVITKKKLIKNHLFQNMAELMGWLLIRPEDKRIGSNSRPIVIPFELGSAADEVKEILIVQLTAKGIDPFESLDYDFLLGKYGNDTVMLTR